MQTLLSGELMSLAEKEIFARIRAAKESLGKKLLILGHHYQREEVIQFSDLRGDSLKLAQLAQESRKPEYIVFCGVHFMAETADMLTQPQQKVILPDMRAGCSMADMASISQLEAAWETFQESFGEKVIPITYVNSTAAIKAFCGRHGGATCTSSNAEKVLAWAFQQAEQVLFLPDQHLGRNTAVKIGVPLSTMVVWDPIEEQFEYQGSGQDGRLLEGQPPGGQASHEPGGSFRGDKKPRIILWKGHCSVHQRFTPEHIRKIRETYPQMRIIVHPECSYEVVQAADESGSTDMIIRRIRESAPGSQWAVGTEMNLVNRLAKEHPEQTIVNLSPLFCPCLTMNRIDPPHLLWALEKLAAGEVVNQIQVPEPTASEARLALERMLNIV